MREILFRGKRTDNGEWVKGFYVCIPDTHYIMTGKFDSLTNGIINSEAYKVDPSTIGQFTGLTDKNGVKIFEGDIIEFDHPYNGKSIHAVVQDGCGWNLSNFYASCFDYPGCAFSEGTKYMTVIGNVHDNPELLEVNESERILRQERGGR